MAAVSAPVVMQRRLPAEEAARADFYSLLARLFHDAPDAPLLASLGRAPALDEAAPFARAWHELTLASQPMDADAARAEYDALFVGVGKAQVSIYAGFYLGAPAGDHPRVRLQRELAAMGLAPRDDHPEPEDHIAGLFDVMRVLVAGGAGRGPGTLADQRAFFESYVGPAMPRFRAAIEAAPAANYYRKVAQFAAAFVAFETESFELE